MRIHSSQLLVQCGHLPHRDSLLHRSFVDSGFAVDVAVEFEFEFDIDVVRGWVVEE